MELTETLGRSLSTKSLWRYPKHDVSSTLHILSAAKYKHYRKGQMGYKERKIDNVENKIITFVIELGVKSIATSCNKGSSVAAWLLCFT